MNEKPIRQNTIVSTTDKRLTLLQWLKQVQSQLKDLKDKGVKAVVEEFDTAEAFYNAYSTKQAGTPVLAIVGSDTAIYGTLNEFTDKVNVKGIIYQGDKVYTSAEADSLSIVGSGELASASDLNAAKILYFSNDQELYDYLKSHTLKKGDQFSYLLDTNSYQLFVGTIAHVWNDLYYNLYGFGIVHNKNLYPDILCYVNPYLKVNEYSSGPIALLSGSGDRNLIQSASKEGIGLFSPKVPNYKYYQFGRLYGWRKTDNNHKIYVIGGSGDSNTTLQGVAIDETNKEIYYGLNGYMKVSSAGAVENAVSGTQLKEAVRLATQKTYWHSVKIKGANGIFTFNAPSTLNTPVVSTEKLLELFRNDTWAGFGKLGTDMLFAIRLLNDNIEFIKADDTKVSIGAFGTLDISDDVKEVK